MSTTVALPHPALTPYVRNVVIGAFPEQSAVLPATADPQIVVYLRGGGCLDHGAVRLRLPDAFLAGAAYAPVRLSADTGTRFLVVNFRPSGLLAALGLSADEFAGRLVPLHDIYPLPTVDSWLDQLRSAPDVAGLMAGVDRFLLTRLRQRRLPGSLLPRLDLCQLLLPAQTLAAKLGLGPRQLERRFLTNFGMPLREYRRFARFNVAYAALASRQAQRGMLAAAAYEGGYVDQAHFTRDFRAIVGVAPTTFLRDGDPGSPYAIWRMRPDQLQTYLP